MSWYHFKRGGWEIAVDAVSQQDARQHIAIHATGAEYQGEYTPATTWNPTTAMTTSKRQEQISNHIRNNK